MVERWEYRLVDSVVSAWQRTGPQVAQWVDELNALGADGWEAVTDVIIYESGRNHEQHPLVLLKRRMP